MYLGWHSYVQGTVLSLYLDNINYGHLWSITEAQAFRSHIQPIEKALDLVGLCVEQYMEPVLTLGKQW